MATDEAPDAATEAGRVSATFTLGVMGEHFPQLKQAAATARLDYVAAVIAMDRAADVPGRHNLQEQAAVEEKLRALGQALADLVRGEASE